MNSILLHQTSKGWAVSENGGAHYELPTLHEALQYIADLYLGSYCEVVFTPKEAVEA